jgi:uncharacterized protein YggE
MKKSLQLLTGLLLASITSVQGQVSGNYHYNNSTAWGSDKSPASNATITNNNEVSLRVNGLMNMLADNYVAVFNLQQVGETAEAANDLMNARLSTFKQRLRNIGVDTSTINVDMLSFVPRYEIQTEKRLFSKTYNEVPAGFELQKNVSVRYRLAAKLDDIVTAAAAGEIYDLVKVDYFIPNTQKSLDSLRAVCLQALKAKVKSFESIGFRLDTQNKVMAENYNTIYPPNRYSTYQAFSRPSLSAATKRSGYQEAPKSNSSFYNPVSYDQYDLVINPIITDPVVQMSYSITVKYFMPQEEKRNSYYLLTPGGDMRQINLK